MLPVHLLSSVNCPTLTPTLSLMLFITDFMMRCFVVSTLFAAGVVAQSGAYGQCGGTGWTGATTCVAGYVCVESSEYYSQCVPGTASSTTASTTLATSTTSKTATTATSSTAAASPTSSGKFKWFGVDESGAEFGTGVFPGTWGIDFIFPANSSLLVCLHCMKREFKQLGSNQYGRH